MTAKYELSAVNQAPRQAQEIDNTGAIVIAGSAIILMVVGLVLGQMLIVLLGVPILLHLGYSRLYSLAHGSMVLEPTDPVDAPEYTIAAEAKTDGSAEQLLARISAPGFKTTWVLTAHNRWWETSVITHRTGVLELFRVDYFTSDLLTTRFISNRTLPTLTLTAYPLHQPLSEIPIPHQLRGLTGPHASNRPGDSSVLRDIHPFTAGDQLRRIDWRTSARRGLNVETGMIDELYVRRTFASGEATIMIVIDSRDSISGDASTWAGGIKPSMIEPTSLDLAREAGGSIARAYLAQGDRVGVEDLGRRRRALPPGAGNRHTQRVIERLAASSPWGSAQKVVRAPHLPNGATVVVCSTFLDESALQVTLGWHRRGHQVIAIDTLPKTRTTLLRTNSQVAAYRLIMAERNIRLRQLRQAGITVITWRDSPVSDLRVATQISSRTARRGGR